MKIELGSPFIHPQIDRKFCSKADQTLCNHFTDATQFTPQSGGSVIAEGGVKHKYKNRQAEKKASEPGVIYAADGAF